MACTRCGTPAPERRVDGSVGVRTASLHPTDHSKGVERVKQQLVLNSRTPPLLPSAPAVAMAMAAMLPVVAAGALVC